MKFRGILGALALCACAFVGCNHDDDGGSTPSTRIRVSVEAGTTTTRTDFQNGQSTWSAGDMIEVAAYEVDGSSVLLSTDLTANAGGSTSATFVGSIDKAVGEQKIPAGKTYDYVAAYPADKVTINGKTVSFTVENAYTVTPNQLNGHLFDFMVAKADDCASIAVTEPAIAEHPAFSFEHMLAFLEITLTGNDSIKTVTVTAPSQICGKVSADLSDGTPSFGYTPSDDNKTITVTINGTLDGGETLYVPVIPGIAHTGTLTVELTCKSGSTHTITKTLNGKTFTRGLVTKVSKVGYAMADGCVSLGEVRSYVENNANNAVSDVNGLQVSATLTDNTLKTDEITFYWSESANGEGTVINGTENVSGQTVTLTAANAAWNDKDIYVWAEVNHNGNVKTTARKQVYVIGSGDVLTTSVYTSYSKYLVRDISAANACDAYTIYNAGYTLAKSVPSRLITKAVSSSATGNLTGQSMGEHTLSDSVTIGGKTFNRTDKVHITGLPYKIDECTEDAYNAFWNTIGKVNFDDGWAIPSSYYKFPNVIYKCGMVSNEFDIPANISAKLLLNAHSSLVGGANLGYGVVNNVEYSSQGTMNFTTSKSDKEATIEFTPSNKRMFIGKNSANIFYIHKCYILYN